MVNKILLLFAVFAIIFSTNLKSQNVVSVFEEVLFYDGYNSLEALENTIVPAPEGVFRLKTSLITTKLSEDKLNLLSGTIRLDVVIKAACDNYDRIGNVNIAFVTKGAEIYNPNTTQRIEIARFITPFMNKNKQPDTVPYTYEVSYLQHLFRDQNIREEFDFWIELDVFGVPYAANTQVAGCSGRSDTFFGTVKFTTTSSESTLENNNVFIPLFMKNDFHNREGGTDTVGQTIRNKLFTIDEDLTDSHLVLITSNHGANSGGEEYNRRWHYVYVNNEEVLCYKPGRTTCEPFRVYNTQANGIYGNRPQSDAQWQSFSNWCPGDVIDNRIINLGALTAGEYLFTIKVPDARFVNGEGNFPLSLYFQGKTSGTIIDVETIISKKNNVFIFPNFVENNISIETDEMVKIVTIHNITGQKIMQINEDVLNINLTSLKSGFYIVHVELGNGDKSVHKIIKR